ncbi:MAG TPA: SpoIIE family protein phosphatase [Thermoleophilaceae bacterium]|nr:SpoIIE family protein phosphatase [Thermoleophilaceae bacterium]
MRQLPELFDVGVKARSLAYLFVAGASLGLLTLLLPHDEGVQDLQLYVLAAIAIAVATLIYVQAERISEWQLHLVLAAGTTILSFANYYTGTSTLYPLLYTWTALYAFYFFSLARAFAHVTYIGFAYAVVLAIQDATSPAIRWLLAVATPLVAGLLISRMLDRLRAQHAETAESARRLSQSEARTRLVLDNSPDAFVTLDRDGIIRTWNVAAERMFGWPASEAVGKPFRALVTPPELRDRHDARRLELVNSSDPVATETYDVELQRRDGSRFPAESTVAKVDVHGEILVSGFIRDMTDRRRRQEEREALMREQAAREEAERVAELVSGMQLLVDAALAHRTLDDILSDLVTRVRAVLQADAASIHLVEEGQLVLRAASDGSPAAPFTGEGFAARVAEAREPLLVQDPTADEVASLIGVPLLAEREVGGVVVASLAAPRRFTADDLSILRLAADRVALAIDHARVYEREHRIAETLQRSLLPEHLPHLPGLAVAARYLPAAEEAEVGGDWYDVLPVPGGGVGLVMGDVAGKGLAAASMVGRLRSALRAYALEGHPPARVLEQLNRLIWTEAEESQMATLIYLVVDAAEGEVRWVNAGHPPPLLLDGDDRAHYLEGGSSVPLGVLPFPDFEEVAVPMDPGGTVVLYTDGLVERPGENIDHGLWRLAEAVRAAPMEPEQLCDHVLRELVPDGGTPDDVALLTLRTIPMTDRFEVTFPATPEALASMRGVLRRWLRHVGGDEQEIAEIVTACGEAATNAIEHAGAGGSAPFEVTGRLEPGGVEIAVRDHGVWRAPRSGDQGRGLSLMRALMDTVEVTPTPEGTTVRLGRTLRAAESTGGEGPNDGAGRARDRRAG